VAYTWAGGIAAVIWVDVAQAGILATGIVISLAYLGRLTPGGPVAGIRLAWDAHKFALGEMTWNPAAKSVWVMAVYGLFWYLQRYTTDQMIVQRYLVARSDRDAVRGVGLGALLCVPVWALFLLIGTLTWAYYGLAGEATPAGAKADEMYPHFLFSHVPSALAGVMLAALFSAAMSGLSSDFNSMAAVGVQDFYGRLRPGAPDPDRLRAGRIFVVLVGALCTGTAFALSGSPGAALPLYFLATSVLSGGLFGLFCLAYLSRRASSAGAGLGIAACLLFTFYAASTSGADRWLDLGAANFAWNALLIGAIGQAVVVAVGYPASLIFPGPTRSASPPAGHPCPPAR
jgi:SSS family solute:Na+ symporter